MAPAKGRETEPAQAATPADSTPIVLSGQIDDNCSAGGFNLGTLARVGSFSGSTVGLANDYGCDAAPACVPACGGCSFYGGAAPDGIVRFTVPASGLWTFRSCGSGFDSSLQLRGGGACPGTSCVAQDDDGCTACNPPFEAKIVASLTSGTTYYLIVDAYDGTGNPFTIEHSGPCTNNADCQDGLFCNGAEVCSGGQCMPGAPPCGGATPFCDEASDICTGCAGPEDCNDNNACTTDLCVSGTCLYGFAYDPATQCCNPASGATTPLSDGNECTADNCNTANGQVSHPPLPGGTPCGDPSDTDCDDPDTCNGAGACLPNTLANGTACDDGLFCITGETCWGGVCTGSPRNCDDGLACTNDSCNEGSASCVSVPAAGNCVIAGACYTDGQSNPANACQVCISGNNAAGWSDVTAIPCVSDNDCPNQQCDEEAGFCACGICDLAILRAQSSGPCTSDDDCDGVATCIQGGCYDPKNRYISIEPPPYDRPILISVGSDDCPGMSKWLAQPNANGVARLSDLPVAVDFSTAPALIQVADQDIVPASVYVLWVIDAEDPSCFAGPVRIPTTPHPAPKDWGDTVGTLVGGGWTAPNGVANVSDFVAAMQRFQGLATAPPVSWVDVHPEVPNGIVNFSDIFILVKAFQGEMFALGGVQNCGMSDYEAANRDEPLPVEELQEKPDSSPPPREDIHKEKREEKQEERKEEKKEEAKDDEKKTDPVYAFSGEFLEDVVDLRIPGRGMDVVWGRKHRSKVGPNTAMGNGWDFSYNIYLEASGANMLVHDGHSRNDLFTPYGVNTWARAEYLALLTRNADGTFTLTYSNKGKLNFRALDGSPAAGKASSIVDRNGNTISFSYDAAGRLTTIHDTLDLASHNRDITIAYNADGKIASVTDYTGRQVVYTYYQTGDAGGSTGDLKSVRSPVVVGTPHGNDFPAGKTTVYTYTKGFADERLNHNLLTITDPNGQTYLQNIYAHTVAPTDSRYTQDPANINFDRVVRQVWGYPWDTVDFVYKPQTPTPANGFAVMKTFVRDRAGNVDENFFDAGNRVVIARRYTGRADNLLPTDLDTASNPPVNPVRVTDPPYFETRYRWNKDSLNVATIYPNGNEDRLVYDTGSGNRRSQGNLLQYCRLPGPLGGDQLQICESYEYDPLLNGDTNLVTAVTDGRGNTFRHTYDTRGNRTHTQGRIATVVEDWEYNAYGQVTAHIHPDNGSGSRRRDEFTYYASGAGNGFLERSVVAAANLSLTTRYEYDSLGRVTRSIDPLGHDTQYVYNTLDQTVRRISRAVVPGSGPRYQTDTFYDANDNVVRVDVQNVSEAGVLQPNTHLSTIYEYEILNFRTRVCEEVGSAALPPTQLTCAGLSPAQFVITEFYYDPNRNRQEVWKGEAVNGNQQNNTEFYAFDERDLVYWMGRSPAVAGQASTKVDYDGNGNITVIHEGIEDAPRVSYTAYDGYNRPIRREDPSANVTGLHYDANGNLTEKSTEGELYDYAGSAQNVPLFRATYAYDGLDRLITQTLDYFDPRTGAPIGSGTSQTTWFYNDNSQVVRVLDDNGEQMLVSYDPANRRKVVTDAEGNTRTYGYDAGSNVISLVDAEVSQLTGATQTYVSAYNYDGLDRLISHTDIVGNTTSYAYDSRGNRTVRTDAAGRQTRYEYDGLDRLIYTVRDMNGNGAILTDLADILTGQAWDDSSRLVSQSDDNGNVTSYDYDGLDRLIATHYADGTVHTRTYDVHDNVVGTTDANGSVTINYFDRNNRLWARFVTPGLGVSEDTTFETYYYDGLDRLVYAHNDAATVHRAFDSTSNLLEEKINNIPTVSTYDGVGNKLTCEYPGGRLLSYDYDGLDRLLSINEGGNSIAEYKHVGPGRVERRDLDNGTRLDLTYDGIANAPGDFGFKQIIRTKHSVIAGGGLVDDRSYVWDRVQNKTQRKDTRAGGPRLTHDYQYDANDRLTRATAKDASNVVIRDTTYDLDGVGNRTTVTGGPGAGAYTMLALTPNPADRQVNQYTITPYETRTYDANGNLIDLDAGIPSGPLFTYDYRNRLVLVFYPPSGKTDVYRYDALGRRIEKVRDVGGANLTTRYFYDGWHVIEEQDGAGSTLATYVHGGAVDELLTMQRGGADYYYHADDLGSIMAVSNAAGAVVERYEYGDYGLPQFLDAAGSPLPVQASAIGNAYHFTGREYDLETRLYNFRTRYLDPRAGRFITRDTIGIWGDESNLGNGYTYCGNNPGSRTDRFGLVADEPVPANAAALQDALGAIAEQAERLERTRQALRETTALTTSGAAGEARRENLRRLGKEEREKENKLKAMKEAAGKAIKKLKGTLTPEEQKKLVDKIEELVEKLGMDKAMSATHPTRGTSMPVPKLIAEARKKASAAENARAAGKPDERADQNERDFSTHVVTGFLQGIQSKATGSERIPGD
ncbi:MAG: hypothetical protein HY763_05065 [Planctomycetes bacterium]|nr:hypothetical protein [Planctomycetota bacterium]